MADFNFYLNRQGVKGNKGEKGETGFAPIVEVAEDTAASYKLRIITDTDTLETPNLRGNAVDDLGGTYMRYDPETQKMYAAAADSATTSSKGEVILASDEAIAGLSDVHALTPASLVDNYDALIQSNDGSVAITQDANNSKINLAVNLSDIEGDISGLDSRITGCETAIGNIEGDITNLQNNKVDKVAGKGLSTNDFTDADKSKLDSSLQPTSVDGTTIGLNAGGQLTLLAQIPTVPTNISAFTNDSGYITGIDSSDVTNALGYTPYDASNPNGYTSNIGTVTSVNNISPISGNVTINIPTDTSDLTNGAGYITSSALTGYATETWVGNQGYLTGITSSDVITALGYTPYSSANPNGYITSASLPTIDQTYDGTSANPQSGVAIAGAGFLTSVPTATTGSLGLVQPDGTTITINNGVISASSSAPSNMVTTDTSQTITANKTFSGNVDKDFSGDTLRLGASGTGRTGLICLSNTGARTWSICNSGYTASTLEIADFNTVTIQGGNLSSDSKLVVGHDSLVFHKSDNTSVDLLAGSIPSNMVTTDTTQTISGSKTFSSDITMSSGNKLSFISDSAYIGEQASGYNIAMVANRSDSQPKTFKVGKEGVGTYYGLDGYFFDTADGGNCIWLGATNYRSAITTTNGQGVAIYPNPLTNNAQERFYIGLNNTLTYRKSDGTVVDILDKGTVDQTYDATSANAQSGVAIAGAGFLNNSATQSSSLAIKATTAPTTYSSTILNGQSVTGNGGTAIGYGTRAVYMSTALGANSYGQGNGSTAVGNNATSAGVRSLAIGGYNPDTMDKAHASAQDAIQIGIGQNSTASSLAIGFNGTNYQLLDGTTGLIPNARINNQLIDGQWVSTNTQIASEVSVNGSTYLEYTLSDVPNDGNKYEVLLTGQVYTSNTSGDNARIQVSSDIVADVHLCAAVTRATQSAIAFGNAVIPVGNRQIKVARGTGWNGIFNLYIKGYRRIGTNS